MIQDLQAEQNALRIELEQLSARAEANERRIEQMTRGGGRSFPEPMREAGRSGYPSAPTPAQRALQQQSSSFQQPVATRSVRPSTGKSRSVIQNVPQFESHVGRVAGTSEDVWEEPSHTKVPSSELDRVEDLLRQTFMKHPALAKKATTEPLQAMMTLLNGLDTNHSGKLDLSEFKGLCTKLRFSATDQALAGLFRRYDLDRSGTIAKDEFCRGLLKEGGFTTKAKSCIGKMREVLSLRAGGFPTMKAMGTQFSIMDRDKSGLLSREEFNIALDILFRAYKVTFTPAEKNSLFSAFDKDGGGVSYDEYIRAVRGDMNEFRYGWVVEAWKILDRDGRGSVTVRDIAEVYDASQNPAVRAQKVSPQEAHESFMSHYDINHDGTVSFDEFVESYNWISASIDNDDYFELMMRNAWHISGGEGWAANTSNLRVFG